MKSLWLKDRPWILTFAIVGAIGLAVAASQVGFMRLFVVGPNRLEILFYGAGSAALLLGAVAVLWDDILGTREFLMQRPISREALIRSRMLACFAVLASWMITVPLASWLHAAFWSDIYDLRFWAGLPEILSTLQIVWPMCAIGFLAASVPSPWWMRLVLAALLTATVGVAIDLGTAKPGAEASVAGFALACWIPALVLFPLAIGCNAQHVDPDRPWSHRTRWMAGVVFVVSLAYTAGGLAREVQKHSTSSLRWEYPRIVNVDNAIRLAVRGEDWTKLVIADENHVPVGSVRSMAQFERIEYRANAMDELFQIEAPRFSGLGGYEARMRGGRIWMGRDGRAWLHQRETGDVRLTGVGAELAAFPRALRLRNVDDVGEELNRSVIVVGDSESGKLWRYDDDLGYFVVWPLPDGDRFEEVSHLRLLEWRNAVAEAPALLSQLLTRDEYVSHLRGVTGSYLVKDGVLVAVDVPRKRNQQRVRTETVTLGDDPLVYSVEVPAHDGLPSFRHDFEPRTSAEFGYASTAMAMAAIRPPLTQVANHLFTDDHSEASIWQDRIVCGGKRTWLLLSGIALSVGCALLIRRRLRRIGADASACNFWVVAIVVGGPVIAVLPLLLESVRNHARPVVAAPPPPRIVSVLKREEILA